MGRHALGMLALACLLAACGGDDSSNNPDAATATADAAPSADGSCPAAKVVYLARGGGDYSPGAEDSRTNHSSILSAPVTVQAWDVADGDFQALVTCVASKLAPFNVIVTGDDPGDAPHREVVYVGNPMEVPPLDQLGLTAVASFTCLTPPDDTAENAIALVNPVVLNDATALCEVSAQMIGNTFGLDHAYDCPDLMTYLSGCGDKTYEDKDVPCGENEARNCGCGGTTQNSYQQILAIAGPACE